MAQDGEKLRFAMGVFEDLPCLKRAAGDLLGLGLSPCHLCVAGQRAAVEHGNAGCWAGAEHVPLLKPLQGAATVLGVLPGGAASWGADTPVVKALHDAALGLAARAYGAEVWVVIGKHLRGGALLLMAKVPSAALQDEAVRILLRYSRHPVHAEEFIPLG